MDQSKIDTASSIVDWLEAYHRHVVVGMENIPEKGRCLLAVNHSLATYDIILLNNRIYKETGRVSRSLMDRWFFKFKFIGDLMKDMGGAEGSQGAAKNLLAEGEIVCVAPGGMRESIRSSEERYQIIWDKRRGFAKLAFDTQSPVVLAACPKADDIFKIYKTKLTMAFYKNFKLPMVPFRGIGPFPLPRPVQLVHYLSEPLLPPKPSADEAARNRQIDRFHKKLITRMQSLVGEAITYRADDFEV